MESGRRPVVAAALAAAAIGLLAAGCGSDPAKATGGRKDTAPREVRVAPAAQAFLPRVITMNGTLAAEQQVALGMKVAGRLSELHVDLGSKVKQGQPLARLAPIDFELRVQQADAALQQARARLGLAPTETNDRVDPDKTSLVRQALAVLEEARIQRARAQELSKKQLLPRSDLDAAEAAYKVADARYHDSLEEARNRQAMLSQRRSELEIAQQQLTDSVLHAPFDGAVREKHAVAGQFVTAGQSVVTLVQVDPLRLQLSIPERDAAEVRAGQEVRVSVAGDPKVYPGKIARLSPAIDERSRSLMVEAEVPNPGGVLRPGAFASVEVVTSTDQPVVFVPVSAIVSFAGIEKVFVVQEGKSVEKGVRTGRRHDEQVEILEGVAKDTEVVVEPGNLVGGQAVTVLR